MNGFAARILPALTNGRITVPFTAGLCLVLLTMVLKNVIHVPAAQLSSDMILYIILYMGFIVSFPLSERAETVPATRTFLWTGMIIITTVGIIAVYAI